MVSSSLKCVICGGPRPKRRRTCGRACAMKLTIQNLQESGKGWKTPTPAHRWNKDDLPNQWGERNTNWKGGKRRGKSGYVEVTIPIGHPLQYTSKHRYIMEHRLVMERHLGRYLEPQERVHHRNGIKDDNRIENLEIVAGKVHLGSVTCPHCQNTFKIR